MVGLEARPRTSANPTTAVRVITYNLHKGRGPRHRDILEEAVHALVARAPDVLACQEVFWGAGEALQACHFITEVLGNPFVFGPNAFYRRGCHGNATFAHMPIEGRANLDISESRLERRGLLHTRLRDGARRLEVFNVHFSLTTWQRRRQLQKLLAALPDDPTVPTLVCGDFNDWSSSIDRLVRRSGRLQNALWQLPLRERLTFPAARPVFGLDRIYFSGLRAKSVRVLSGDPWARLSDHLPVEAELEPVSDDPGPTATN